MSGLKKKVSKIDGFIIPEAFLWRSNRAAIFPLFVPNPTIFRAHFVSRARQRPPLTVLHQPWTINIIDENTFLFWTEAITQCIECLFSVQKLKGIKILKKSWIWFGLIFEAKIQNRSFVKVEFMDKNWYFKHGQDIAHSTTHDFDIFPHILWVTLIVICFIYLAKNAFGFFAQSGPYFNIVIEKQFCWYR